MLGVRPEPKFKVLCNLWANLPILFVDNKDRTELSFSRLASNLGEGEGLRVLAFLNCEYTSMTVGKYDCSMERYTQISLFASWGKAKGTAEGFQYKSTASLAAPQQ